MEDGYTTYIYNTINGKYCTNWRWPYDCTMHCGSDTASSNQVYHFHWS
jgi:hypothetical protein